MLFTSYAFIGFAAALLLLYYCIPKKAQWVLLLAASYLFYAIAGPEFLPYIFATTATVYLAARLLERTADKQAACLKAHKADWSKEEKKAYKGKQKQKRLAVLILCLLFNLGILAVVKYSDFFLSNVNGILRAAGSARTLSFLGLAVPLGISFYTFQSVGYLIDVYRGAVRAERNPFRFALFVSFFPQLIQGPIGRYGALRETLYGPHRFDGKTVAFGLERVLWGYFKKMVVADRLLVAVTALVSDTQLYSGAYAPVILLFYTVQLYADFTGGIDITIGLAEAMGIRMQENFLRPYFSKSLKEYWRRWHISMCSWFRDYLFYPISVSPGMRRLTKFTRRHFGERAGKRLPLYLSTAAVWFATGVWHGASWNFIVWGMCNWAVLMLSEECEPLYKKFHARFSVGKTFPYKLFRVARTFALVCALNLFDCYASVADTGRVFFSMFTASNWHVLRDGSLLELGLAPADYAVLAIGVLLMLAVSLLQRRGSLREQILRRPYPVRFCLWFGLFLLVLLLGAYGFGYDASQFIYNQF